MGPRMGPGFKDPFKFRGSARLYLEDHGTYSVRL